MGDFSEIFPAQQAHPVFGKEAGVYHAGMLQGLLQETDAADGLPLDALASARSSATLG